MTSYTFLADDFRRICRNGPLEEVEDIYNDVPEKQRYKLIHQYHDVPLRDACHMGHYDIVEFLISKGADIYAKNHWAIVRTKSKRMFNLLLNLYDPWHIQFVINTFYDPCRGYKYYWKYLRLQKVYEMKKHQIMEGVYDVLPKFLSSDLVEYILKFLL